MLDVEAEEEEAEEVEESHRIDTYHLGVRGPGKAVPSCGVQGYAFRLFG
jgi:hypothetical protein